MTTTTQAVRATILVICLNVLLLALKAGASSMSNSLTIFSETINSLTDVAASIAILICVRVGRQAADENHPFGHTRAEPIAGLITAIFGGIMGWEVLHRPILSLLSGEARTFEIGTWGLPVLVFTMLSKGALAGYLFRLARRVGSPALRASAVDSRNDVLVTLLSITGVVLSQLHPAIDAATAVLVGIYILYQAYEVGLENVNYLMGSVPDSSMIASIRHQAYSVTGVDEVEQIRAHYVGNFIHVELAIVLDADMPTGDSHRLAEEARSAVEALPSIDRAFIHVEPRHA